MRRPTLGLLLVALLVTFSPFTVGGEWLRAAAQSPANDNSLKGDFVPGQLIIRFKPGVTKTQLSDFYAQYGLSEKNNLDRDPSDQDEGLKLAGLQVDITEQLIDLLETDERVAFVEPNYLLHIDTGLLAPLAQQPAKAPNDPDYSKLWGLHNSGQTGGTADADIDAPETWEITTGSSDVIIGVIDTGVDYKHEDLIKNMWSNPGECPGGKCETNNKDDDNNGYVDDFYGINAIDDSGDPMDDYGHGTHVAGTIGAVGNNGLGVAGVNWNVRIAACKFLSASGSGSVAGAVKCFQYFLALKTKYKQNIVATSNSWGGAINSEALRDAMSGADQPLHICAAGNGNTNVPHFPAAFELDHIIAVAATDHNDRYASFSNHGVPWVDLAAPGVDILSTVPKASCPLCSPTGYDTVSGTSMATPHVSGAVAMIYGQYPKLSREQVKQRLLAAGDSLRDRSKLTLTNSRLNLLNTLENDPTPPAAVADLAVSGVLLTRVNLSWTATGDDGVKGKANGYDIRYAEAPISEANWGKALPIPGAPMPQAPGAKESFTVTGLEPGKGYYFAIKVLDNVGNSSELSNVVVGKTSAGTVVFADDMENGPDQWTTSGQNNLWHLSQLRANSPVTAWYYGKEETRNYDTGGANNGVITSKSIDVVGADDALLTFYEWGQVQSSVRLDRTRVQISTDGQTWQTLFESHGTEGSFVQRSISLSEFITATGALQLRFWFDTIDATSNNFEGWYVDDVQVLTARLELPGEAAPTPNLVMQDGNLLFHPIDPLEGDNVTLHATVLNHGDADANDVLVQFVEVTPNGPMPIGPSQSIPNLAVGGSGMAQVDYATVGKAGVRTIRVLVDPNNFVAEANEADNNATATLTVGSTPAANLVVRPTNIGFEPPVPDPGDQVTIRATILNTGTVAARAVAVQFADVTGAGSLLIGSPQTIDLIPPGGSSVVAMTFDTTNIAPSLTGRDIEVAVDVNNTIPESSESDNRAERTLKWTPQLAPNLNVQASNIGFDPVNPTAGEVITIYATILNDGSAPANAVAVQFMEVFGSSSAPIGPQQIIDSLPTGGSAVVQMTFDTTNRPGDRKLEVMADPNNFLAEGKESDNKAQKTLKVIPSPAPNLAMQASNINFSPANPIAGQPVTIFATVLNNGATDVGEVTVQFMDATNGGALPIDDKQTIRAIAAGGSGVAQVSYETSGKVGDRQIQVVVDANNLIRETDESDNNARDGLRITAPPAPNLVVLANNVEFYPPAPTDRDTVTIHAVVLNNGLASASNVLVQFIDLTSGNATPIGKEKFIELIPAGGSGTVEAALEAKPGAPGLPNNRRILVIVDSNNLVSEINENDNSAIKMLPISASAAPNLVMLAANIGFNPPQPTDGEPVTIYALVLNDGEAEATNVVVQFVDVTSGRPLPIGAEQSIASIPVGGSGVAQVIFDSAGQVGEHLIRVAVDPNNLIAESDETDNKNATPLTVVLPPATNLLVHPGNIGFNPSNPSQGQAVSVTVTILNNGEVTANDVLVQFVDITDGGFVPIGAKQTIAAIEAGGSAATQVAYPTNEKEGERRIQVMVDPHTTIPESNEADNFATQSLFVTPPPAPNLVVQEGNIGFSPANPNAGDQVTVSATVLNSGQAEARDVVVQFLDVSASGSGLPIGPSQTISSIPAAGSGLVQVAYNTVGMTGERKLQVVADSNNLILETNETDNVTRKTLRVAAPPAPNLNIQAGNIGFNPALPNPGDQVTIFATVVNDGNAPAYDVLVQLMDVTNSSGAAPIGQPQSISALAAGGSGVVEFTYDTTAMSGDRKVQVLVDPNNFVRESKESDNSVQKTLTLAAPTAPNLSVLATNIGFEPAAPSDGDNVLIIATIFNDGNAEVGNVIVQFIDATVSPAEPIGAPQTIDVLPVGGSGVAQVSYPTSGKAGSRRVQVLVDPNNFVVESKETDNNATRSLFVMPLAAPNLLMVSSNIGFNPPTPVEGDQVIVNAVVLNNGATTASDITLQLLDLTDGTGIPVGAPQVIAAIAPGSSDATQMVYHTAGKVGDRKLQVVVDPNNFVAESNEEDNQAVSTLAVAAAPAPNLNVLPGNIKFDPPTPEQGDLVTITVTLLNDGSATANDVLVQLTDVTNGASQPIGAERTIDAIDAGSSAAIQLLYEASGEPGERAIQVAVDPANIVRESNETDNSAVKSLTITAPIIPNLVVQPNAITFVPPNPIDGDPVTVTVTVLNHGTGVADNILVTVVDATDGGAEPIGDAQTIATLPPGGSAQATVSYLTSGKAGDRRILVTVDPDNAIEESEERDNVAVKTLRVLSESERPPAQPNLVVKAEAIQFNPITTTAGSPVTVTVTITNAGAAEAVDVTVQFADATGGGAELIGRTLLTGTLPAGRSGRTRIIYDTTGRTGKRDIQVTADPDNTITELDETDNQATRSITVTNGSAAPTVSKPVAVATLDQPNLMVLDDEIEVYSPDYVVSENGGDQVTIEVTVLNTGVRDAHNIGVQFLMMTNRGWEPLGDKQTIEHIAPGSGVTTTVDYDLSDQLGFREVRVLVDPDNTIYETNEADNRASKVIQNQ